MFFFILACLSKLKYKSVLFIKVLLRQIISLTELESDCEHLHSLISSTGSLLRACQNSVLQVTFIHVSILFDLAFQR